MIVVRVRILHERPEAAGRELRGLAGFDGRCVDGVWEWEFHAREWADFFELAARNVAGVKVLGD